MNQLETKISFGFWPKKEEDDDLVKDIKDDKDEKDNTDALVPVK